MKSVWYTAISGDSVNKFHVEDSRRDSRRCRKSLDLSHVE